MTETTTVPTVTPIDLTHPPTDAGLRALLGIVPDIQNAIGRIEAIEANVRKWIGEEVAAAVAAVEGAHAPAPTSIAFSVPALTSAEVSLPTTVTP